MTPRFSHGLDLLKLLRQRLATMLALHREHRAHFLNLCWRRQGAMMAGMALLSTRFALALFSPPALPRLPHQPIGGWWFGRVSGIPLARCQLPLQIRDLLFSVGDLFFGISDLLLGIGDLLIPFRYRSWSLSISCCCRSTCRCSSSRLGGCGCACRLGFACLLLARRAAHTFIQAKMTYFRTKVQKNRQRYLNCYLLHNRSWGRRPRF